MGHCLRVMEEADAVVVCMAENCPLLQSLDFWRARTLSARALCVLARRCPNLTSLDIGWCRDVDGTALIPTLARSCKGLRKLFLTALRTISDNCLAALVEHCKGMEQLDFLGSGLITPAAVTAVLQGCPSLVLMDVSFCRQITGTDVRVWRENFPRVSIKKSFVS